MVVKDVMIPVKDCAQLPVERTVYDAIIMLESLRQRYDKGEYKPRVLLVYDQSFNVIGSLRHADLLRAFVAEGACTERAVTPDTPIREWAEFPASAKACKVKDIMHFPGETEFVSEDTVIEKGILKLLAGPFLHLLVKAPDDRVSGILRLADVFSLACKDVKRFAQR